MLGLEERLRRSQGKLRARLWPKASEQRPKAQRKRTKQGDEVATVVQNVNLRLLLRDGERSGSPVSKGRRGVKHRPNVEAFPAPHETHTPRVCSLRTRAQGHGAPRPRLLGASRQDQAWAAGEGSLLSLRARVDARFRDP